MKNRIAQVVVGLPVEGPFDYNVELEHRAMIDVGKRVWVPFGQRRLVGYVVGFKKTSKIKRLRPIISVIDIYPIVNTSFLKFAKKIAEYYCCSWGEAIEMALPRSLRHGKEILKFIPVQIKKIPPVKEEKLLIHTMGDFKHWPYLIDEIIKARTSHKDVVFLVPSVFDVPYIEEMLRKNNIADSIFLDKGASDTEELERWIAIKQRRPSIVIGARSAIFAPVENVGLIIVYDEEHSAYKQEQAPFYHARDVALMRAKTDKCKVAFVSCAPSTELWWQATKKKMQVLSFGPDYKSSVQVIDIANYKMRKGTLLSIPLKQSIQKILAENKTILLFMNRKGFSTFIRCTRCSHMLRCPRCNVNLTYIYAQKNLVCRLCNYKLKKPDVCPECNGGYVSYMGVGIEKLESEVAREFPQARISIYDKDTHELSGNPNIIIATQAIMNIKHKLLVDIVGVVQVDSELHHLDFRSAQKTFSLLLSLKKLARDKLVIQTRMPDNYCIDAAQKMNCRKFYRNELKLRREAEFPPYSNIISLIVRSPKEDSASQQAQSLYKALLKYSGDNVDIVDPQPDIRPKLRGKFRYLVMLKGKDLEGIITLVHKALKIVKKKSATHISVDVNP